MDQFAEIFAGWGYAGVFVSAFLAGSILPFASEAVLVVLVKSGLSPWWSLLWATSGNTLGGITCYMIGRMGKIEWMERWLKISPERLERTRRFLRGRGSLMALFVALPYVGDVIAVALGFMRSNFTLATAAMAVGKFLRYLLILYLAKGVISLF